MRPFYLPDNREYIKIQEWLLKQSYVHRNILLTILWKFQSSYEWRVNTVNRYIGKSIIVRKPILAITRSYNWENSAGVNLELYTKYIYSSRISVVSSSEKNYEYKNFSFLNNFLKYLTQALVARTPPPFSNFLFTNLFSIKILYFFIISSLFPYFNLFVSIFIQSYVNFKLHVSTLLDTNNTQSMQLSRFKNCTPARFEYIYCTLFPLCHSN